MSVEEKSQQTQHHHHEHHEHHHHHHHKDDASRFKYEALTSIRRRKLFAKWLYRALWVIAGILMIAVVAVYTL
jgi:G3E family GTPase